MKNLTNKQFGFCVLMAESKSSVFHDVFMKLDNAKRMCPLGDN